MYSPEETNLLSSVQIQSNISSAKISSAKTSVVQRIFAKSWNLDPVCMAANISSANISSANCKDFLCKVGPLFHTKALEFCKDGQNLQLSQGPWAGFGWKWEENVPSNAHLRLFWTILSCFLDTWGRLQPAALIWGRVPPGTRTLVQKCSTSSAKQSVLQRFWGSSWTFAELVFSCTYCICEWNGPDRIEYRKWSNFWTL